MALPNIPEAVRQQASRHLARIDHLARHLIALGLEHLGGEQQVCETLLQALELLRRECYLVALVDVEGLAQWHVALECTYV